MSFNKLSYCDVHDGVIVSFQYIYGETKVCPLCETLKKVEGLEKTIEELTDTLEETRQEE